MQIRCSPAEVKRLCDIKYEVEALMRKLAEAERQYHMDILAIVQSRDLELGEDTCFKFDFSYAQESIMLIPTKEITPGIITIQRKQSTMRYFQEDGR